MSGAAHAPEARVETAAAAHLEWAASIRDAIDREVDAGAIGMARRSIADIEACVRRGDAVIATLRDEAGREDWAGFCYIAPWDAGRFVATSGLIVRPEHRGRGLARRLKEAALALARARYPAARPFGLTTSLAVIAVNRALGFAEARYAELPQDPAFWMGCRSCPWYPVLEAAAGRACRCTAMLGPQV